MLPAEVAPAAFEPGLHALVVLRVQKLRAERLIAINLPVGQPVPVWQAVLDMGMDAGFDHGATLTQECV